MKYKLCFSGLGSECVVGEVSDEIWEYVKDKCDSDGSVYGDRLDSGGVPEDLRLAEDMGSFYDVHPLMFHEYAPYTGCKICVVEVDTGREVAQLKLDDCEVATEYKSCTCGRPYFIWESVEKGCWSNDIEIDVDGEFDASKLRFNTTQISYSQDDYCLRFIVTFDYDGETYELDEADTTGKSYELNFFEGEDCETEGDD